jgi:hypothetical protein
LYSQPPIGKLTIGASLAASGTADPIEVIEYDWLLDPEADLARGAVPSKDALCFARLPGALAVWFGALMLGARCAALGCRDVGVLATALASNPQWLANSLRAGMDALAILFGLLATYAAQRFARFGHALS